MIYFETAKILRIYHYRFLVLHSLLQRREIGNEIELVDNMSEDWGEGESLSRIDTGYWTL